MIVKRNLIDNKEHIRTFKLYIDKNEERMAVSNIEVNSDKMFNIISQSYTYNGYAHTPSTFKVGLSAYNGYAHTPSTFKVGLSAISVKEVT